MPSAPFDPFQHPEHISAMARYREINKLDQIFDAKQYEGRPDWWTGCHRKGQDPVPVRERKPCIRYKLAAAATNQVVRFLFGDKTFPKVSVPFDDPDTPEASEGDLSEEQAKQLDRWLDDLIESASLKAKTRAVARMGIARKTAVVVIEVKDGEFSLSLPRPQDCYARFELDDPARPVTRLVWCYEFDKEVTDPQGKPICERYYFRREWDATNVSVYADVKKELGNPVVWGTPAVTPHGLTFCPVIWIRNESEAANGIDGCGLYEGLEEDLEALDMTLSRRHQGVIVLGAPQPFETGVEDGDGPDASSGGGVGGVAPSEGEGEGPHGKMAARRRRVSPDLMWTYQGQQVTVGLLEVSGKAFEVATNHVNDIRSRVIETMGIVLTSMADTVSRITTGAEMSAKFLELAHAPLIALVQEYRPTWWGHGLKAILSMMMRMVADLAPGQTVNVAGTDKVTPLLTSFYQDGQWRCPRLEPKWGRFFESSTQEVLTLVDASTKATDANLVQRKTAVQAVAPEFGVEDIQAELSAIEEEREEAEQKELDAESRKMAATHDALSKLGQGNNPPGARPGLRPGPKGPTGPGGSPQGKPGGDD